MGGYGDPLDPQGTQKAVAEIRRVMAPGGDVYLSVPVGSKGVYFNAYRVFVPEEFLSWFEGFDLEEAFWIRRDRQILSKERSQWHRLCLGPEMVVGCFHLIKKAGGTDHGGQSQGSESHGGTQ